jgi:hypothetical protein
VIKVMGPNSAPPLSELRAAIREQVPEWIPVTVIEEAGRRSPL